MSAQEFNKYSFDFGGGFTTGVGNTGRYLDNGCNVHGGFGYNFSPYLGAKLNPGSDWMDINGATLSNVGIAGGDVRVFHLTPKRRIDFYVHRGRRTKFFRRVSLETLKGNSISNGDLVEEAGLPLHRGQKSASTIHLHWLRGSRGILPHLIENSGRAAGI